MLQIGITGGIGSGKTTVCQIFATLGIPIYYADNEAKRLMVEDEELIAQVKIIFGEAAYFEDGGLNRKHVAQIAFSTPAKLALLNAAVHPAVARDGIRWNQAQKGVPYTLKEAALLFESGSNKTLDKVICVSAPLELRIKRVLERDQTSREAVLARADKQLSEELKIQQSDFVIINDGKQLLIPQVYRIHQELCQL